MSNYYCGGGHIVRQKNKETKEAMLYLAVHITVRVMENVIVVTVAAGGLLEVF